MLKELKVRNFALVEKLDIEFSDGLNVLTGETGAGKSILLDSIGILCGNRASLEYIRRGETKAFVEGYFELTDELEKVMNDLELVEVENNEIFLSREISTTGSNKCKINYKTVPLSVYQNIGSLLFDIHGQNQEQSILLNDKQLELVDEFLVKANTNDDADIIDEIKKIYNEYKSLVNRKNELSFNEKEDMISYYEYAVKEIDVGNLNIEEENKLKEDRTRILNNEKIVKKSNEIYQLLYVNGILDKLNSATYLLGELSNIDTSMNEIYQKFNDVYYEIESVSSEFKNYYEDLDYDENRINAIESRIEEINRLKRKYGKSIEDIFDKRSEMVEKIESFENIIENSQKLENEIIEKLNQYLEKADILSKLRKKASKQLVEAISEKLKELNIYENGFEIEFEKLDLPTNKGSDFVEFYFSPNVGEGRQPLKKIASGGEISRIMLALKGVLAEYDIIPSLIFDEIDSGVGGEALLKVAESLEKIGRKRQVICVTHSPIVAAFADRIIGVIKKEIEGRTLVVAEHLAGEEDIINELSRMLGGKENFNASKTQSKEMILFALSRKNV